MPSQAQIDARNAAAGAAPSSTSGSASGSSPTIASLYGSENETDKGIDTSVGVYKDIANTPVDEQAIRDATTRRLQAEIDATNSVYAEKMRQAQIAGEGRLGSNAAISARRGLLGSDFGTQANNKVVTDNNAIYSGIDQEKAAAIAGITDKGQQEATAEIAAKNAAKQAGATDYINFLTEADARKATRTNTAASAALAQGVDLTTLSPTDLSAIASSYNIDPNALTSAFVSAKNAAAAAQKATLTSVPVTDSIYKTNPDGTQTLVQKGTATPDSTLKEYQYAVQNDGYTGSLADWNAQKANQKVSVGVNSQTGDTYQRSGPTAAGIPSSNSNSKSSVTLPSSTPKTTAAPSAAPVSSATPTVPKTGTVDNPYDKMSGSDLAYAQTGDPNKAKLKNYNQINAAEARIKALVPDWSPANAAAQYSFFKSPDTQKFIANSNTVLNTINDPTNGIKALSDKVDRSNVTILANGQLGLARATSDPATAKFVQQANILADEISKLLGSGAGSDFTIQLGQTLVNPAYSKSTFNATMDNLDSRVRNKVSEYLKQGGQAASTQTAAADSASALPPEVDDALSKNATVDEGAKTVTIPRAVWSTFGANMDAVLAGVAAKGYKLLVQ
jgi:hypothetical protein